MQTLIFVGISLLSWWRFLFKYQCTANINWLQFGNVTVSVCVYCDMSHLFCHVWIRFFKNLSLVKVVVKNLHFWSYYVAEKWEMWQIPGSSRVSKLTADFFCLWQTMKINTQTSPFWKNQFMYPTTWKVLVTLLSWPHKAHDACHNYF